MADENGEPVDDENGNGGGVALLDAPMQTAAGDPVAPIATPLVMTDAYVEVNGVNLRCLALHAEINPENKPIDVTTMCGITEYPGPIKWHFICKFAQSFDVGATDATLYAAVQNYQNTGAPSTFKLRPHASTIASATNPVYSGQVIPSPYRYIGGDAGALSEVDIDWVMTGPPNKDTGSVVATGATAGSPGFFTPSGANPPANLAALTGITAVPATAWAVGQWVNTADLLANHWTGSAWAAGKA
jgi:hypothetical protein